MSELEKIQLLIDVQEAFRWMEEAAQLYFELGTAQCAQDWNDAKEKYLPLMHKAFMINLKWRD